MRWECREFFPDQAGKGSVLSSYEPETELLWMWPGHSCFLLSGDGEALQVSLQGGNPQYVHNHVFRDAINGTWGEEVSLALGEQKVLEYNDIVLDAAWKPENVSVVAFVYNDDGVVQATQCKLSE